MMESPKCADCGEPTGILNILCAKCSKEKKMDFEEWWGEYRQTAFIKNMPLSEEQDHEQTAEEAWQACRSETIKECVEIAENQLQYTEDENIDDEFEAGWDSAIRTIAQELREMGGE